MKPPDEDFIKAEGIGCLVYSLIILAFIVISILK